MRNDEGAVIRLDLAEGAGTIRGIKRIKTERREGHAAFLCHTVTTLYLD